MILGHVCSGTQNEGSSGRAASTARRSPKRGPMSRMCASDLSARSSPAETLTSTAPDVSSGARAARWRDRHTNASERGHRGKSRIGVVLEVEAVDPPRPPHGEPPAPSRWKIDDRRARPTHDDAVDWCAERPRSGHSLRCYSQIGAGISRRPRDPQDLVAVIARRGRVQRVTKYDRDNLAGCAEHVWQPWSRVAEAAPCPRWQHDTLYVRPAWADRLRRLATAATTTGGQSGETEREQHHPPTRTVADL
jgi:hypothetical protein